MIYLTWLALFIELPLLILAIVGRRQLWRRRGALAWMLLGALILGGAWDRLAVVAAIWYYHAANISGVWLGGLPLEEWLWISGTSLLFGGLTVLIHERRSHA
jgi:lycopene beta-cyclase